MVVPVTLDQVYMLKVEGTAFQFLPDPIQIKNALEEHQISRVESTDFPFSSWDLLVIKKKNKRCCPIYFQKEDIEKTLSLVSRASRGAALSQHILVGSLEVRKMEISKKNFGSEDLIFIPPVVVLDPRFESLCGNLDVDCELKKQLKKIKDLEAVNDLNGRLTLIKGKQPYYLKKSELQKQKLTEEFKELKLHEAGVST
ncbi:Protein TIC 22, chloroplastic [Orobanche gracilis]